MRETLRLSEPHKLEGELSIRKWSLELVPQFLKWKQNHDFCDYNWLMLMMKNSNNKGIKTSKDVL